MSLEAPRDDVGSLAVGAEREEAPCRRARDPRQPLLGVAQPAPVRAQSRRVVRTRGELACMSGRPHVIAFLRSVDLALHELIDEWRNFAIAACGLQRAELEPQRGRVRSRLLPQLPQHRERVERPTLLELHLRVEHHPRHGEAVGLGRLSA